MNGKHVIPVIVVGIIIGKIYGVCIMHKMHKCINAQIENVFKLGLVLVYGSVY